MTDHFSPLCSVLNYVDMLSIERMFCTAHLLFLSAEE